MYNTKNKFLLIMSCKILLLVVVVVLVVVIATGGCVMFLTNIFGGKDHGGEDAMMNATESIPDYEDEIMSSESVAIVSRLVLFIYPE